jgi:diguanylate cyclase (GGDEF)-like protein/PAS domain S-box-containing protein
MYSYPAVISSGRDTNLDLEHEVLLQFLYMAPVGLAQTSLDGEIVMVNPVSAQLLLPVSPDGELTNLFTALEGVAPDLRHLTAGFRQPQGSICDGLRIQVDAGVRGKTDPRFLSLSLLKLGANQLMAVLSDVTQQVKRERLLRQNEAWLSAIFTGITDYAIVSLDSAGLINDWNASIGRVTGFSRDAVIGRPFSIFYPPDGTTPDRIQDRLREAEINGWSLDDGWRVKADGTRFWGSAMISPLHVPFDPSLVVAGRAIEVEGAPAYCLVMRDITDKREASESLRKSTSCDHLTGIANRRMFFESAEVELIRWRHSPRDLSLILFDVDHFKQVNDTYGHPSGDAVLRHLATLLTNTFREVDVVARIGGEEFAVLLPSTGLATASVVAERLRKAIEPNAVEANGFRIRYTVSGGVATMEDGVADLDGLIKRADESLYAAKASGRNNIQSWSRASAASNPEKPTHVD